MDNKKYIKVVNNDYGYDIYVTNNGETKRFSPQAKIVMKNVLKEFKCIKKDNNVFIFPDHDLIMLKFQKERLTQKRKKINRKKSNQIIAGFLIAATILGGAHAISNIAKNDVTTDTKYEQIIEETAPTIISNYENDYDESTNDFCYEFAKPNDKEALINSENYMSVFYKYEKMYGVDAKLLCAIGAQESSGIHRSNSTNGGYATGLMGIEYIWDNADLRVFNFEKNAYETIVVDYSKIGELDYNVKIGSAIFQNYFYHTLKNSDGIEETDYLAFSLQKYNMGPGNMRKVLAYGDNWIDNRDMINAGDKYYFEHVLSRFDNGTVINVRLTDGSYYSTKLTNLSLEKHLSRS